MLLDQPLARTAELQASAVHQQVHGLGARARPRHLQRRCPAAEGGMVGHPQRQAEQADDRTDQPLGLPVGEAEHGAQGQCRQDRQRRIPGLPTPGGARLRRPRFDRLGGEPDRQAPALAEAGVVLAPVRHLASLARNMVATVLVQLEGHGGYPGVRRGGALLRHSASQHQPADPCTTLPYVPGKSLTRNNLVYCIHIDTRERVGPASPYRADVLRQHLQPR